MKNNDSKAAISNQKDGVTILRKFREKILRKDQKVGFVAPADILVKMLNEQQIQITAGVQNGEAGFERPHYLHRKHHVPDSDKNTDKNSDGLI